MKAKTPTNIDLFNSSHLITAYQIAPESKDYEACSFSIDGEHLICRTSKQTPKKVGQFVTFWKRNKTGIIEPYKDADSVDFYVIVTEEKNGLFLFPKSILIKKGIISTSRREGKRGFRVYSIWDKPTSKQALKTQQWQTNYFHPIDSKFNLIEAINKSTTA